MPGKSKKDLSEAQKSYLQEVKAIEPKRPAFSNCVRSFLVGGLICVLGQGLAEIFIRYFGFTPENAGSPTSAVLIFISALLTGLGVYDIIAQWAGAGTAVPITGFANTIASAAIEHKSEGFVLGVGGNMFKLAGPVIVFGVFSAFVVALVKILINVLGGI